MKMIVAALAFALVAVISAAPVEEPIAILRSSFEKGPEGAYSFGYETGNGIVRNEQGELKDVVDEENKPHKVVIVRGTYSYTDNQGKPESISYYADETGYHAEGESVPKAVSRR